ncbi:glycosyl hydrolase [Telluribacter sp. SYSU D00476]|uniref:glycosyl hydrolase n=1 Tax=Telluribacter sp. SYSU D00476 TaxID=2811430 RepID=UPI001FF16B80|nr:glycosyl hydrolase [Telluribacter sp. SYSU D00476]
MVSFNQYLSYASKTRLNRWKILSLLTITVAALFFSFRKSSIPVVSLEVIQAGFKNPPIQARPKVYWWWLNGYVDKVRLKEELLAIKNAGLGGVDIFEIGLPPASDPNGIIPAGPAYMGDESLDVIEMAIKEAGKLDLEVGLNLASSWNAGGSWVQPKHAAKTLYFSKTPLSGNQSASLKLPFPTITPDRNGNPRQIEYDETGRPVYKEEVAVIAVPAGARHLADTSAIVNVSRYFDPKTETLSWKAPAGNWDVYRYVCSNSGEQLIRPTPNSQGPIIDHFDSTATEMHLMYFINRLQPRLGDLGKSALKYLYLASYEAKEFTWTSSLPATFRQLHGYDIYKFLPAVYTPEVFAPKTYEGFHFDFTKTFSELMINNHYRKSNEICNRYGLKITSEAGGPGHLHHIPVETLKALGSLDIPRGEFWYNRTFFDKDSIVDLIWLVKEIAAASHIYKRGMVEEEAFTSYWDWQEGPADLKTIADRAFCEGMNRLVIHGFTHNPTGFGYPGIAYFAGTHYNDRRAWWPKIKPFNEYLSRISYILQQTDFVADVLYYYGDKVPNLVPPKNTRFSVGPGYDYEIINTEVLIKNLTVDRGELVLPGVGRYKVLTLGNESEMNPEALAKIRELVRQGAIIVGQKPAGTAGLSQQPGASTRLAAIADPLWTTKPFNGKAREKGKIYAGTSPLLVLESLQVAPDFSYSGQKEGALDYIHYAKNGNDFYLIRNTTDQWVTKSCLFRQKGKAPQLWDPVTGEVAPVSIYEQTSTQTALPLTLPPHGTYFVVFTNEKPRAHFQPVAGSGTDIPMIHYTKDGFYTLSNRPTEVKKGTAMQRVEALSPLTTLTGSWNLTFPKGWGAPEKSTFPTLISWTEAPEKGIRYFSGIAAYDKAFQLSKMAQGTRVFLDLGDIAKVAEVWVNGKPMGITWSKPHRYDITEAAREGENQLKVEVANTWSNRMTGDALTGEKFTNTNIVKANKNLTPWGEVPLKKSGLLGPVTLWTVKPTKP